ncbi:MAG: hypothetical protein ACKVX7_00725 [Planctomycetota bacterium]
MCNWKKLISVFALSLTVLLGACTAEKPSTSPPAKPAGTTPKDPHEKAPVVELGSGPVGPFSVHVTRDVGAIKPGGDAPIDATITAGPGTPLAVRFWVGTQDATGSIKAKAEIEDPKSPNRWHTHAEIPSPLPANSKVWVEIEDEKKQKHAAGFELKP